ncbi:MAG: hypothetical protein HRT37_26610 [Alteromonadaceae bacterium]|nr:hypothetical protein [Alteromonadaceae bacterium]
MREEFSQELDRGSINNDGDKTYNFYQELIIRHKSHEKANKIAFEIFHSKDKFQKYSYQEIYTFVEEKSKSWFESDLGKGSIITFVNVTGIDLLVLDWGKGVFLEQDTQGNHLLFGKNNTDETSLRHSYEDKKPVFSIKRTKEKDTELVRLEEGKIILQTKEDE